MTNPTCKPDLQVADLLDNLDALHAAAARSQAKTNDWDVAIWGHYPAISKELRKLLNELELARLALAKREPEPETYTIGGSSE